MSTNFTDLLYKEEKGVATITINRPKVLNAFSPHTVEELIQAFLKAGWSKAIGVIVLTGIGDRAFSTGGDQSAHIGHYEGRGTNGMPIEELHSLIRDVPKPVIARVPGYAIGGGNVLAALCDLTIASDKAVFGQVGPKMGSVDPGFGTAYLARIVGEKKALEMVLCNFVVPAAELDAEIDKVCGEILARSPTALAIAKRSFNADSDSIRGIGGLGMQALRLFYDSAESKEGVNAFKEKRAPDWAQFRR